LLYLAAWLVMEKAPQDALPAPHAGRNNGEGGRRDGGPGPEPSAARGAGAAVHDRFQARHGGQHAADDTLQDELRSGRREFKYCARKFITLQSRLARMEAYVT